MKYRTNLYKEWVDDTQTTVTSAVIKDNKAVIDWLYAGKPQLGRATSADGLNFQGKYEEPGIPNGDWGMFHFRVYTLSEGLLLLGRWTSKVHGDEKEFLLLLEPESKV